MKFASHSIIRTLAGLTLLASLSLGIAGSVSANSPACGALPQFNGYDGTSQTGTLLGVQCPQVQTIGLDNDFSDNRDAFRGSDNDKMSSWKFYNDTGSTWCLEIFENAGRSQGGGTSQTFTLASTSTWWGPSGGGMGSMNNKASSIEFWKKSSNPC